MNTTHTPSPLDMARRMQFSVPTVATEVTVTDPASTLPSEVIKAKQLKVGQQVRTWLTIDGTGKPCGAIKTVGEVSKVSVDGMVTVSYSSPHPGGTFKAAARFFVVEDVDA